MLGIDQKARYLELGLQIQQKPANEADQCSTARSKGDHVEVEVTRANRKKFFRRRNLCLVPYFRFRLKKSCVFQRIPFFFLLGAPRASKKTGVFVGVKPARTIGAAAQKVILAQRLGFGAGACLRVG